MRVIFAGSGEVAIPSLELIAARHELAAVLTRPDAARGRGRHISRDVVATWADAHCIPVLQPQRVDAEAQAQLTQLAPQACAVVSYGCLLPEAALQIPPLGWVNLHFSLLPAWRGAAPVQHAIMAGDELTGATTFRIEADLDTGPTYGVMTETIRPTDTAGTLLDRLAHAGAPLLLATLDALESGTAVATPQPNEGVSYAGKLTTDDARIDWNLPARIIERRIRGCTPKPGAWTTWRGQRLGIGPARVVTSENLSAATLSEPVPGRIQATKREVFVAAADGWLQLGEVQPAGRNHLAAADWARGARPDSGERLQ